MSAFKFTGVLTLHSKQLTKEYPTILTPENVWIIGITREPSTREYYLVFYYEIRDILDRFIRLNKYAKLEHFQYSDFDEIKEIGVGGYGTVYTAEYKGEEIRKETVDSNGLRVLIKHRNYLFQR